MEVQVWKPSRQLLWGSSPGEGWAEGGSSPRQKGVACLGEVGHGVQQEGSEKSADL